MQMFCVLVLMNYHTHAVSYYPFGAVSGDHTLPLGDNESSGVIALDSPAFFYGKSVKDVVVSLYSCRCVYFYSNSLNSYSAKVRRHINFHCRSMRMDTLEWEEVRVVRLLKFSHFPILMDLWLHSGLMSLAAPPLAVFTGERLKTQHFCLGRGMRSHWLMEEQSP